MSRSRRATRIAFLTVLVACLAAPAPALGARNPWSYPPEQLPLEAFASSDLAVLDFDDDGWLDIATVGPQKLALVRGLEDGWAPAQIVDLPGATNSDTARVVAAEMTGDEFEDLVVGLGQAGVVVLVRGRGDGVLAAPAAGDVHAVVPEDTTTSPPIQVSLDVGDVDGDGDGDVAAGFNHGLTSEIPILANDGDGDLTVGGGPVAESPTDVALVTLGGDADPDLVVAGRPPASSGLVEVFPGAAGLGFGDGAYFGAGDRPPERLDSGDFDGDGRADVVAAAVSSVPYEPTAHLLPGAAGEPKLGAPVPVPKMDGYCCEFTGAAVTAADLDRDGALDLVQPHEGGAVAFMGNGALGFTRRWALRAVFDRVLPSSVSVADVDGDDREDVLTVLPTTSGAVIDVLYGLGAAIYPPTAEFDFGNVTVGRSSNTVAGAFTNDGPATANGISIVADGDISDFVVDQDGCTGGTLVTDGKCTMGVHFQPRQAGERGASVALVSPESDTVYWMDLFGTGVATAAPVAPTPPAPSPAQPKPPPSGTMAGKPRMRLAGKGSKRSVLTGLRATCRADGPACTLKVLVIERRKAAAKAAVVARSSAAVKAGRTKAVSATLTRAGRRLLRRRARVGVALQISLTRAAAAPLIRTLSGTLRR